MVSTSDRGVDARVEPGNSAGAGVALAVADRIGAVAGVRSVRLNASSPVVILRPDAHRLGTGGAQAVGSIWQPPSAQIGPPTELITGTAPATADEVALNEGAARRGHLAVGDRITVITLARGRQAVRISGIYRIRADTGGYAGALFAQQRALQLFTDGSHVDSVDIAAQPGVSQRTLARTISGLLPADLKATTGQQVRRDDESASTRALSFITYFLVGFGAIALLVGTFIIYNTFAMIVAQRLRELALLRAIGANRRQIRRSVLTEAALIGGVGSAVGVGSGIGLAYGVQAALKAFGAGLPSGGLVLAPRTVIVAFMVGIVATLASAMAPARRAASVAPVAAMRAEFATTTTASLRRRTILGVVVILAGSAATACGFVSSAAGAAGVAASLTALGMLAVVAGTMLAAPLLSRLVIGVLGAGLTRPFGTTGRLARTNAVRNPRRTAATGFALTVGLLLVSGIAVVGASTKSSVNGVVDSDVRADYIVSGSDFGVPPAAAAAVAQVSGVGSLTELATFRTTIAGEDADGEAVTGSLSEMVAVRLKAGSAVLTGTDMLVSSTEAARKQWRVGTRVPMTAPGGATVAEAIVGIYADSPLLRSWMVSGRTYRELTSTNGRVDDVALVRAAPGADLHALRAGLERATAPYEVIEVQNRAEFKKSQANSVDALLSVLYGLLGLAVVIAVLGILNTLALSVVERRREIGMLRAVGMQRRQVRRTIHLEAAMIALFGALMGIGIGLCYGVLFTHTLRGLGLQVIRVPWIQAAEFLLVAVVVGVLAALWPAARAARTPPLAVIAES